MKVGVLALQGAFAEHIEVLTDLHVEAAAVRLPEDLNGVMALIIPGGESTTISRLLSAYHLREPIKNFINKGLPVLGTCAGMILLAKKITGAEVEPLGVMDIEVTRNAFGRQVNSFETDLPIPVLGDNAFHSVFIRAPVIQKVEPGVEVLCQINNNAVAVKQGKILACAFHPELANDLRFHRYFLNFITGDDIAKGNR
jgi:5'-phosphate synthase pdxT subunit